MRPHPRYPMPRPSAGARRPASYLSKHIDDPFQSTCQTLLQYFFQQTSSLMSKQMSTSVSKPKLVSVVSSELISQTTEETECSFFKPHKKRPDLCINCENNLSEHSASAIPSSMCALRVSGGVLQDVAALDLELNFTGNRLSEGEDS